MLGLIAGTLPPSRLEILCIGAHCDDIEIGCGGTLLTLQKQFSGCRIHWMVLTSNDPRRHEALASAQTFLSRRARGELRVHALPDGRLPAHFNEVKSCFEDLKTSLRPDLIFTHHLSDRHQDHALVGGVTWQTFRDHLILEYEIPKYEGDLQQPNLYVPLSAGAARRKITEITAHFRSQSSKSWFTEQNLEAIMRLRGLECRSEDGYAEAFHARKLVWNGDVSPKRHPRRKTPSAR